MSAAEDDRFVTMYLSGSSADVKMKIKALLAAIRPETRNAIEALAQAEAKTRRSVLESVDPKARLAIEAVLRHMS